MVSSIGCWRQMVPSIGQWQRSTGCSHGESLFGTARPPVAAPSPAVFPRTHVPGQDGVPDRVDPPPASGRPPPAKKRRRTVLDRVKGLFKRSGRKAQRVVGRTATSALDTALDSFNQQLQDSVERATSRLPGVGRTTRVQNPSRKRSGVKRKSASSRSSTTKKRRKGGAGYARALLI